MRRRASNWLLPILITLAAATTGVAIGWSTGQSGLDSTVLAAVLPVILTGVAGGAGAVVIKITSTWRESPGEFGDAERRLVVLAAVAVISFSTAFLLGTVLGAYAYAQARDRDATEAVRAAAELEQILVGQRYEYLVRCTQEFVRLNRLREKANEKKPALNLEPLTIDQVCIGLVTPTSTETPLVALIDDDRFLRLSADTEKDHYEYLERCSLGQAAANAANSDSKQHAHVTIGQVCPALVSPVSVNR